MAKEEIGAICTAQHIITFRDQAAKEVKADFGEPCENCPMAHKCDFDWLSKIAPVVENSKIKISMVLPEQN